MRMYMYVDPDKWPSVCSSLTLRNNDATLQPTLGQFHQLFQAELNLNIFLKKSKIIF